MIHFDFDTEGFLMQPGLQAPPIVCLQFKSDRPELIHARDPACYRTLRTALETPDVLWSAHYAQHDLVSIMASYPDLTEPIFDLLDRNGAVCTVIVQKLIDIARGIFKDVRGRGYALDVVAERLKCPQAVDKKDPWRLRYGELYLVPVAQWPEEARRYALLDAEAQAWVREGQMASAAKHGVPLFDAFAQTRAALWIHLTACRGIQVDRERAEKYVEGIKKELEHDRKICREHDLVRDDDTRNTKAAMRRMVELCERTGEPDVPLTEVGEREVRAFLKIGARDPIPPGSSYRWWASLAHEEKKQKGVCLNEDAVILYGDEILESYQRVVTASLQVSRAERLLVAARAGKPIQSHFPTLQETGRLNCTQGDSDKDVPSAFGFQLFNPAKDKEITNKDGTKWTRKGPREIFVSRGSDEYAPEGYAFVSTDWEGAEASGVAQVCIWTPGVGFSRLAQVINAGGNLPTEFGAMIAGISKEAAYASRKDERKKAFDAGPRQSAKIALYGYFANMGPAKLALQARKQYRVNMTEDEARHYKELLKQFAPELPLYWEWGQRMLDTPIVRRDGTPVLDRFNRPMRVCSRFTQYVSGRVRGRLTYTELLNTTFQGLVSDLFKIAGWRMCREMYTGRYWNDRKRESPLARSRKVNAPHDDFLVETPLDVLTESAERQCEIMRETTREKCPDVDFRVQPAAMFRWYKDAETVRDENGKLIPWEPKK